MATHHAAPGEVVDLSTWANDLPEEKSKAIVKTGAMELARLVLSAGREMAGHRVEGPLVVHCLSGRITVTLASGERLLSAGQLLYLQPRESHAVRAHDNSVVLLTIVFP